MADLLTKRDFRIAVVENHGIYGSEKKNVFEIRQWFEGFPSGDIKNYYTRVVAYRETQKQAESFVNRRIAAINRIIARRVQIQTN